MFSKKIIAAGLIAVTTLAAVPANANGITVQFGFGSPGFGWNPGHRHGAPIWQQRLSPREVRSILRRHGYRAIRFLDARGPVYQVSARRFGHTVFLVVSARNGDILSRHRV